MVHRSTVIQAQKGTHAGYIEQLSANQFKAQREMLFDKDVEYELLYQEDNFVFVRTVL